MANKKINDLTPAGSVSDLMQLETDTSGSIANKVTALQVDSYILTGKSGGRIFYGGNAASENLTLVSTSHATKGLINFGEAATSFFTEATNTLTLSNLTASSLIGADASKQIVTITDLPNGTTATTQTALDNSTKVATTAYVDSAVSVENLWNRAGTVLSPSNSGDSISLPGSGSLINVGTATDAATPAITMTFANSGYAAPSNIGLTSVGDKWVFWNSAIAYKGAIGFNSREMWFQSTDTGVSDNRFRWFGGSAGIPVEMLTIGDISGFIWNDTNLPIDFRAEGDADPYLLYLKGSTDQFCIGTNTPDVGFKLTVNNGTSGGYFKSTVAIGTSPYACTSTTLNTNLNADLLDSFHATEFAILAGQAGGQTLNGGTAASQNLILDSTANGTKGQVQIANGTVLHVNTASYETTISDNNDIPNKKYVDDLLAGENLWDRTSTFLVTHNAGDSVQLANTAAFYLGDNATDGTWRIVLSTNDLSFERRESGSYVSKGKILASP